MKFTLLSQHETYFRNHGFVSFSGLISDESREEISRVSKWKERDLWRDSTFLKKILIYKIFPAIAKPLSEQTLLRLGFDQIIRLKESTTLANLGSIQGVVIGMLIPLKPCSEDPPIYPKGDEAVFLSFEAILPPSAGSYYLAVWTEARARYVHNDDDPYTADLKKFGYAYGDRLADNHHPICHR